MPEDYEISEQQFSIESQMQENREVLSYELEDVMAALAHLIKNSEITNDLDTIKKYTNYVSSELYEYMYENKKIFLEFDHMLDILKQKNYLIYLMMNVVQFLIYQK